MKGCFLYSLCGAAAGLLAYQVAQVLPLWISVPVGVLSFAGLVYLLCGALSSKK